MAQETGKVLRWLKRQGDAVTKGEPLLEIETDKATMELEAPESGVLTGVSAAEGEDVPVGRLIARIIAPGDAGAPNAAARSRSAATAPATPAPATPAPAASTPATSVPTTPAPASPLAPGPAPARASAHRAPGAPHRVAASPKARRLARERGIDLAALAGSGPAGVVVAGDVLQMAAAPTPGTVSLGTVWRLMAERTTRTWTTVPHFFLMCEVEASRLMAWRTEQQERIGLNLTYTDLLVKLAAAALREHPRLNARWENGTVLSGEGINIGVAVAIDEGLVVPVIHGADRLSLEAISRRRREVVDRARAGRLRPDDIAGGTFTISNLGMYRVDAFTAIINAPQAAILAVGRIADRVVPVDGLPGVRPMLIMSLACDHRVVDGARGAQFLGTLSNLIEEPASLMP
jgi:pyruvate dehydrogenase E2 component (dihydrolipoamide acetyltransferase)